MVSGAEDAGQFFVDDFHDLLARAEAFEHFAAHGTLFDRGDEISRNPVVHIGFQQ